jgi:ribose transport system substrate-binding protein
MPSSRLLLLSTAALLMVGTAACGSSEETAEGGEAAQAADRKSVGFVVGVSTDPFYVSMGCGAQDKADELGVTLDLQGATKWGPDLQTPVLNAMVAKKHDALVVVPTDAKALISPLKSIAEDGTELVLADTTLEDTSFVASGVATDNVAAGQLAAETMHGLTSKGTIMLVGDLPGVSTVNDRRKGFEDQLAEYPDLSLTDNVFDPNGDTAKLSALISAALAKDSAIVGIYTLYTGAGEAAVTAVRQKGLRGKVKVISFDASPTQIEGVRAGDVDALIAQKPAEIGAQAVANAVKAADGETVEESVGIDAAAITSENVEDPETAEYFYKASC